MKIIIKILILLFLFACTHKKLIEDVSIGGTCQEKIKDIKLPPGQAIIDISKQVTGSALSFAITGVGATTDALMILLTNPLTKFTVCMGFIALTSSSSNYVYNANNSDLCSSIIKTPTYNPKLGKKALDSTQSWRCPNLDYVSEGLRNVASCYADLGEVNKARLQLYSILNNKIISKCLSRNESNLIKNQISNI